MFKKKKPTKHFVLFHLEETDVSDRAKNSLDKLGAQYTIEEEFSKALQCKEATILVTSNADWSEANLSQLKRLTGIVTTGTATDYIDSQYVNDKNISLRNTDKYTGYAVAEHALALALSQGKQLCKSHANIINKGTDSFLAPNIEFREKTVGIVGFGDIGQKSANLFRSVGCKVIFFNRSKKTSDFAEQVEKDTLLKKSNILLFTVHLNPSTRDFINKTNLKELNDGVLIVNVSADEIISYEALSSGLETGRIGGAGLDVIGDPSRYSHLPNCTVTNARAWYTPEGAYRRQTVWLNELLSLLS